MQSTLETALRSIESGERLRAAHRCTGMRLLRAFLWHCDSDGVNALRTGVLAVLAGAAIALSGLILDDVVYQPTRELPGRWVAGHFQSEPFWILWRASRYVVSVELPDTFVPTEDHSVDSSTHLTQRCGQPFPNGISWSVRHGGRVIAQQTGQIARWCEDPLLGHALRAEMGTFHASPGTGYSIRIEAPPWAPASGRSRLPLHLMMGSPTDAGARIGLPAVVSLYVLLTLGSVCLALGGVLLIMERLQIMQRLERHLQGRRDPNPAG
jgi:hypothetical protein